MILVLSGTGDGRKIIQYLSRQGYQVGAMASTSYGRELAVEDGALPLEESVLDAPEEWLTRWNVQAVIDARHPFSVPDKDLFAEVSVKMGLLHLRVGREETPYESNKLIQPVYSMAEASEIAPMLGKNIFLTTGSHELGCFVGLQEKGIRLVVRVLPEHRVIKKCQDMGIKTRDIVAMQGPFSKQINKALFKMYRASVVVTKDSGRAGGTDTKIDAALSLGIPVVIVKRRGIAVAQELQWEEVVNILLKKLPL